MTAQELINQLKEFHPDAKVNLFCIDDNGDLKVLENHYFLVNTDSNGLKIITMSKR